MKKIASIVLVALAHSSAVFAIDYERVLLPVAPTFGTSWLVTSYIYNGDPAPLSYYPSLAPCGRGLTCPAPPVAPGTVQQLAVFGILPDGPTPGEFVYVPVTQSANVHFSQRISHRDQPNDVAFPFVIAGTELPAIRERDFRLQVIHLFPVTLSDQFSQTLRIYDIDDAGGRGYTLRFYHPESGSTLLQAHVVTVPPSFHGAPPYEVAYPAGLQIHTVAGAFPAIGHFLYGVGIEITADNPTAPFWAFVSLTDLSTNSVSLVTPN